jgi:hypothetical protein
MSRPARNRNSSGADRNNNLYTDDQIIAAMRSTEFKTGVVACIRYRARAELMSAEDAAHLADEVADADLLRLRTKHGDQVQLATHEVLTGMSKPRPLRENGVSTGVEFHRYVVGAACTIEEAGVDVIQAGELEIEYEYQIMPLAQLYGRRLTSVWGQDGLPGTHRDREVRCTRMVVEILLRQASGPLCMGGTPLPMVEVRSLKIGELEGQPIFGFTILGSSPSLNLRITAASEELAEHGLLSVTMDDYREKALAARDTGNQELDAVEALTAGRKFMLWGIPRDLTTDTLAGAAKEFFGDAFETCEITLSQRCHPYGWVVLNTAEDSARDKAADFEAVAQSLWGHTVNLALSKTRQQRIRMAAAHRDRMDQHDALNRPSGILKEILIPAKQIQDAIMEGAFLDLWIDAMYTRLGPRLIEDLGAAIGEKVKDMVEERVQHELSKRLADFEHDVIRRVLATIDSAVDFSLDRAVQARSIDIAAARDHEGFDVGDDMEYGDLLKSTDEELNELEKTVVASQQNSTQQEEPATPMPTDSAAAKRVRSEILDDLATGVEQEAAVDEAVETCRSALGERTNSEADKENTPAPKRRGAMDAFVTRTSPSN